MIVVALYSISRDLVKLHRRSLTAMIYMDKFGKILRHYLKERHKISKLAKFEGDASWAWEDMVPQICEHLQAFVNGGQVCVV